MKTVILRGILVWIVFGAMVGDGWGAEVYVIGGEAHPWEEAMEASDRIDFRVREGAMEPIRVDPEERLATFPAPFGNIYNAVFHADGEDAVLAVLDGDLDTALERQLSVGVERMTPRTILNLDLGAPFTVNRFRFYTREDYKHRFILEFGIDVNDGVRMNDDGTPVWSRAVLEENNESWMVEREIAPQTVRYVRLNPNPHGKALGELVNDQPWEIAEFEIYGQDYVSEASYTSEIIDFEEPAGWGEIWWAGERQGDARVWIQTRTGTDEDPNVYWRKTGTKGQETMLSESGKPLTKKDYESLRGHLRGRITYDSEHWSFWSAPYDFEAGLAGVPITSPGPRRFFQVRVLFLPTRTEGAFVDSIAFRFSKPPLAQEVVAEIAPIHVQPGALTTFTYAFSPTMTARNPGFDSIEILTPERADRIRSVRIDGEEEASFTSRVEEDRFEVAFPKVTVDGTLVEVVFDTRVFTYGTSFVGRVFDSTTEEVSQLVTPGDATLEIESDDLLVRTSLKESVILSVEASPNPFSPNGDALNEVVHISYSLSQLARPTPVAVKIYEPSGALVRSVYAGEDVAGRFVRDWDGKDEDGALVPPGVYLYRVGIEADEGLEVNVGTVGVVY